MPTKVKSAPAIAPHEVRSAPLIKSSTGFLHSLNAPPNGQSGVLKLPDSAGLQLSVPTKMKLDSVQSRTLVQKKQLLATLQQDMTTLLLQNDKFSGAEPKDLSELKKTSEPYEKEFQVVAQNYNQSDLIYSMLTRTADKIKLLTEALSSNPTSEPAKKLKKLLEQGPISKAVLVTEIQKDGLESYTNTEQTNWQKALEKRNALTKQSKDQFYATYKTQQNEYYEKMKKLDTEIWAAKNSIGEIEHPTQSSFAGFTLRSQ